MKFNRFQLFYPTGHVSEIGQAKTSVGNGDIGFQTRSEWFQPMGTRERPVGTMPNGALYAL